MPEYEGWVSSLTEEGRARVVIGPVSPGIPHAPGLSRRVCHGATDSSTLTVDAINGMGARVGDRVCVRRDSRVLVRNVGLLLGVPALGLALGLALARMLPWGPHSSVWISIGLACLGAISGATIGIRAYSRVSGGNLPVIHRILDTYEDQYGHPLCSPHDSDKKGQSCLGCGG